MVIQNPMKVKYIKLLNAEELVAKVVEETDTILEIKDPAIIMLRPAESKVTWQFKWDTIVLTQKRI